MASSASPAANVVYVEEKPTDGGVYKWIDGQWYCCICGLFAPESHRYSKNHLWYLSQLRAGKLRPIEVAALQDMHAAGHGSAPPPPPGVPTDNLSGPPPAPAALSEENIILVKLHTKLDIILDKLRSMEARLEDIEQKIAAWAWQ